MRHDRLGSTRDFELAHPRQTPISQTPDRKENHMKSEHRHDLAQNDLEKYGKQIAGKYNEYMEENGNRILLWACVVMLSTAAIVYWVRSSRATNAQGWAQLTTARSAEELAGVAETYPGTTIGDWATLLKAENNLRVGTRLMFTNRDPALKELEEAKAGFDQLVGSSGTSKDILPRAMYGLGQTLESTSDGDLSKAIEQYTKIMEDFAGSVQAELAEERIKVLKRGGTSEFYSWFLAQNPKPEDRPEPNDGRPADVPGMSNIGIPPAPGLDGKGGPGFGNIPVAPEDDTDTEGDSDNPPAPSMPEEPETEVREPFPTESEVKESDTKEPAVEDAKATEKPTPKKTDVDETGSEKPAQNNADSKKTEAEKPKPVEPTEAETTEEAPETTTSSDKPAETDKPETDGKN